MLFNSFHFFLFFIVVTSAYFVLPHRLRWQWLLASSCYFYMVFLPIYILILGFTIVVDYFAGIWLENSSGSRKKWFLICSLIANIGVLAVFKYYNFLNNNLSAILNTAGYHNSIPNLSILLPVGLSFHTFQAMSYTIEVYRGKYKAERNFGIYALYVMFYPQLVAGPIERPQNILHQFYEKHNFDYDRVVSGLRLILWGFFKKVVIADRLAMVTDPIFNNPHQFDSPAILLGVFFFTFQIFCDFSGYSDIALGTARVMGFQLMQNFNRPYHSKSISEFWSRWHISLSSWFKDYLYISLGGNRVSIPRWYFNLFFVFLVSGLWHGANWTFIVWGALHGFYLIAALLTDRLKSKIGIGQLKVPAIVQITSTFILVMCSWVFFRANNLKESGVIFRKLFSFSHYKNSVTYIQSIAPKLPLYNIQLGLVLILVLEVIHYTQHRLDVPKLVTQTPRVVRWIAYYAVIFLIFYFGVFEKRQFIYFQF